MSRKVLEVVVLGMWSVKIQIPAKGLLAREKKGDSLGRALSAEPPKYPFDVLTIFGLIHVIQVFILSQKSCKLQLEWVRRLFRVLEMVVFDLL